MKTPKATLGGFPLLRSQTVAWTHTAGVRPDIHSFSMPAASAAAILKDQDKPVDLLISFGSSVVNVRNLYVLHAAPSDNPHVARVVVADRRWMWGHRAIKRDYNVRREAGVRRSTVQGAPEVEVTSPDVRYWPWSLRSGLLPNSPPVTWKVSDIVKDIVENALTIERDRFGVAIGAEYFVDGGKEETDNVEVENFSIPGDGADSAISRLLSMVPALGITVNDSGAVIVFRKDKKSKNAKDATFGMGPPVDGGGILIDLNNRLLRPERILVRMDREVEIRLDSIEEPISGQTFAEPNLDARGMQNVGQVTDQYISLRSKRYPQGTWMSFRELVPLFEERAGKRLNDEDIRRALVPFGPDLWQKLVVSSLANPNVEWGARIAMIEKCYRRTYKIHDKYLTRLRSFRPYRVSTVNQSTGGRAEASVYSDYATIPSMRGQTLGLIHDKPAGWVEETTGLGVADTVAFTNFYGWAARIADAKPAPAFVRVLDHDQGIILIDYQTSIMGLDKSVLPSVVTPNPTLDIRQVGTGKHILSTDSVTSENKNAEHPALSERSRVTVILTAVPASPNDNRSLHTVQVTPSMVEAWMGNGGSLGECLGPTMEIYVGPNVATAKIMWNDDRVSDIDMCFGIGGGIDGNPNLQGLVLNDAESTEETGASVQGTALAVAQQIYMTLIDRPLGQQEGALTPSQKVEGWKEKVTHSLRGDGKLRTGISFPERLPRLNLSEYLDSNTRRAMLKLAQPP